jgi:hypothetical protein
MVYVLKLHPPVKVMVPLPLGAIFIFIGPGLAPAALTGATATGLAMETAPPDVLTSAPPSVKSVIKMGVLLAPKGLVPLAMFTMPVHGAELKPSWVSVVKPLAAPRVIEPAPSIVNTPVPLIGALIIFAEEAPA